MKADETLFWEIEEFLDGRLPPETRAVFEEKMAADPTLAKLVLRQKLERGALELQLEKRLREKMAYWENLPPGAGFPSENNPKTGFLQKKTWIWVVAAIMVLAAGLYFFREKTPENQPENLPKTEPKESLPTPIADAPIEPMPAEKTPLKTTADPKVLAAVRAAYQRPDDLFGQLRGDEKTPEDAIWKPVFAAFSENPPDFQAAIQLLLSIKKGGGAASEQARRPLGHAYFGAKNYREAAQVFGEMAKTAPTASTRDEAEWYFLVAKLNASGQISAADKLILETMRDPKNEHGFAREAADLARKLR